MLKRYFNILKLCSYLSFSLSSGQESAVEYGGILDALKREVEAIEGEETGLQSGLVDVKHELDKYVSKMRENNARIKHFQNEVSQWTY